MQLLELCRCPADHLCPLMMNGWMLTQMGSGMASVARRGTQLFRGRQAERADTTGRTVSDRRAVSRGGACGRRRSGKTGLCQRAPAAPAGPAGVPIKTTAEGEGWAAGLEGQASFAAALGKIAGLATGRDQNCGGVRGYSQAGGNRLFFVEGNQNRSHASPGWECVNGAGWVGRAAGLAQSPAPQNRPPGTKTWDRNSGTARDQPGAQGARAVKSGAVAVLS